VTLRHRANFRLPRRVYACPTYPQATSNIDGARHQPSASRFPRLSKFRPLHSPALDPHLDTHELPPVRLELRELLPSPPRLLRLRLHMVRDHEPVTVDFLVDISHEVIELGRPSILHFLFASFLTHLPREVAIDVNMLV